MKVVVLVFAFLGLASGQVEPFGPNLQVFVNGIMTFDGHSCIIRDGDLRVVRSTPFRAQIGQNYDYNIENGTATLVSGETVGIRDGIVNLRVLSGTDTLELQSSLARAGITLVQFIQQIGTIPPQRVFDVIAGVISINGVLYNIKAGVFVVVRVEEIIIPGGPGSRPVQTRRAVSQGSWPSSQHFGHAGRKGSGPSSPGQFVSRGGQGSVPSSQEKFGPAGGQFRPVAGQGSSPSTLGQFGPLGGRGSVPSSQGQFGGTGQQPNVAPAVAQTVTFTETAAHETTTVFEQVTLTKTQTQDEVVTITNPVYNSIAATITNIVKQTVTIPEEQVIRSPVAGSIVVNTIPVPFQTTLSVSVRNTNMFVRTVTDGVINTHVHYVTNYSIRTATVNNPVTSTVVQTISQTQVSTVYNTSLVGSTLYVTTTHTVNIGTGGATTQPGGYY